MALRKIILTEGETYHIFNKTNYDLPLFKNKHEYSIFLEATHYYLQDEPPIKFSKYKKSKSKYNLDFSQKLVSVICFCLMPNHFHFILKQELKRGIEKFMRRLCNSYAHYFNTKYETAGSLFHGSFKSIRIKNDEQLLHLSRYIHLNPVTSYLVENPENYSFSSYLSYLGKKKLDFLDASLILNQFKSPKDYEAFVLARKDYQRGLEKIKHLILE
jgi:putative transposase